MCILIDSLSIKNDGRYVFLIRLDLMFSMSLWRSNFSLVARYLLKFTRCSLLVVESIVAKFARYSLKKLLVAKNHSLLVAEVACCKTLCVTSCKICSLLIAEVARYKNLLLLVAKFARYSLQNSSHFLQLYEKVTPAQMFSCEFLPKTLKTIIMLNICKRLPLKIISNANKLFLVFYVNQVFHFDLIKFD